MIQVTATSAATSSSPSSSAKYGLINSVAYIFFFVCFFTRSRGKKKKKQCFVLLCNIYILFNTEWLHFFHNDRLWSATTANSERDEREVKTGGDAMPKVSLTLIYHRLNTHMNILYDFSKSIHIENYMAARFVPVAIFFLFGKAVHYLTEKMAIFNGFDCFLHDFI